MSDEFRSLSKSDVERLRDDVATHDLPAAVEPVLDEYARVAGDRDSFIWRWLHRLFPHVRLSCVDPAAAERVRTAKLLASIYVSAVDDVAESHGDRATFEEASKVPFDHLHPRPDREGVDADLVSFAATVWDRFDGIVADAPRAPEFADVLRFDFRQALTAIEFSALANRHLELLAPEEVSRYDAHNMLVYVCADVDLLHSPEFDATELAPLRRVLARTQRMARIGNWLTTWKRELAEGDLSSGVIARALDRGVVTLAELEALRDEPTDERVETIARRIDENDVEDFYLRQWHEDFAAVEALEPVIESVDVESYLEGFETVRRYHVASEGLK
ncbi:hypothetical protein [Salinilacihabitans rarus]|uniref:hypothetical protein n=1 Tax=Salinilacihabitans rarus TaxID=2961596 RepID=UPI0020C84A26|nr:hypothetical protein [Salinilacihabitans rarus]